ncbi:MAG: DUF370 domain-containing protein [Clostridia bacterium]|nr:DUF370 domain-containing protein [Clostridia bacterium]
MSRGVMLHIGSGYLINTETIVGIFDLDKTTYGTRTREFLAKAEKAGNVISAGYELPKSFIVCSENGRGRVYLSQLASSTLQKRYEEEIKRK